jgi:hypothetical protein
MQRCAAGGPGAGRPRVSPPAARLQGASAAPPAGSRCCVFRACQPPSHHGSRAPPCCCLPRGAPRRPAVGGEGQLRRAGTRARASAGTVRGAVRGGAQTVRASHERGAPRARGAGRRLAMAGTGPRKDSAAPAVKAQDGVGVDQPGLPLTLGGGCHLYLPCSHGGIAPALSGSARAVGCGAWAVGPGAGARHSGRYHSHTLGGPRRPALRGRGPYHCNRVLSQMQFSSVLRRASAVRARAANRPDGCDGVQVSLDERRNVLENRHYKDCLGTASQRLFFARCIG